MRTVRITGETSSLNQLERFGDEGRTLGSYLSETINGVDLKLGDPFGGKHIVSLAPFAGEHPDRFLVFRYIVSLEDGSFNPDYSDAVVLEEFELPPGTQLPE